MIKELRSTSLRRKWAGEGNVSAFAEHRQFRRDLLVIIAVSKSSLTSPDADTPIRRHISPAAGARISNRKRPRGAHPYLCIREKLYRGGSLKEKPLF